MSLVHKRAWTKFSDEILLEILSGRLTGEAQRVMKNWIMEDPEILNSFSRVENEFIMRFKNYKNPWTLLIEYRNLKMDLNEEINDYAAKFLNAYRMVDAEECATAQYFFSMPTRIRQLLVQHSGPWPRNLETMISLSKEVVMREKAAASNTLPDLQSIREVVKGSSIIICFSCGKSGHIAKNCFDKDKINQNKTEIKTIKINNLNDYSTFCLPVFLVHAKIETIVMALVDSGASACYISNSLVQSLGIEKNKKSKSVRLGLAVEITISGGS